MIFMYLAMGASLTGALYLMHAWLHLQRDHDRLQVQVEHLLDTAGTAFQHIKPALQVRVKSRKTQNRT